MGKNYVGDVGLAVSLDVGVDLTGAGECTILVQLPNGTEATWPATAEGTKLTHVTAADELAQAGVYRLQAAFTLGGWTGRGETATMTVHEPFA